MSTGSSDSVLVIRFIVVSMPEASKMRAHPKEAMPAENFPRTTSR